MTTRKKLKPSSQRPVSPQISQLILLNKPYGMVSQFSTDDPRTETLSSIIQYPDFYPAGRLDKNSEGLLLLTCDGSLQHRLSHPKFNKKKYYWVQVEGTPTDAQLMPLRKGLTVDSLQFLPAEVHAIVPPTVWERIPPIRVRKSIPTSWLEIILTEGKNHQVRRMTACIGFPTLRLIRHRIGNWTLGSLQPGEYSLIV